MRSDMAKVITERPRYGYRLRSKKTAKTLSKNEISIAVEFEDKFPRRVPSRRHDKEFTDLINPLERYLRKQVGRSWNDVYSELSQHLDRRSITGQHIWTHVKGLVEIHTEFVGHQVWSKPPFPGPVSGLYVYPVTGMLCWSSTRRFPKYRPESDPNVIKLDELNQLHRFTGIWYLVAFEKRLETEVTWESCRVCRKSFDHTILPPLDGHDYIGQPIVKTEEKLVRQLKKQLNHKELLRHALKNQIGNHNGA